VDFSLTESERDLVGLCREFAQKEIAAAEPHIVTPYTWAMKVPAQAFRSAGT
jgi:hypothetical protein